MGRLDPSRRNFPYPGPLALMLAPRPEIKISEKEQTISRFVNVESNLINVDHIVRVRQHKNDALSIYLDNGKVIKTDYACERVLADITGRDFIVGTAPCEGYLSPSIMGMGHGSIPCASLLSPGTARCGP